MKYSGLSTSVPHDDGKTWKSLSESRSTRQSRRRAGYGQVVRLNIA